jgi:hypothetical protein
MTMFLTIAALIAALVFLVFPRQLVPGSPDERSLPRVDSINAGWAVTRPAKDVHAKYAPSKSLTTLETAFRFEAVCRCCASVFETFRLQKHKSRLHQAAFASLKMKALMRSCSSGS